MATHLLAPRRPRPRVRSLLYLAAPLALCLPGCGSAPSVYVHPNADFATINRIAVLPTENLSTDRFAGERLREMLTVELLADSPYDVVDPVQVNRVLAERSLVPTLTQLSPEEIQAIGADLGAQALMTGTVLEFRERRTGTVTVPEVSLSLRLIDIESGIPIWSVGDARTGVPFWTRLFGIGEESMTDSLQKLLRDLLPTMY